MPITFRPARSSEAAEIACFHVEVWRKTYADIVPIEALEKLDVAYRLPVWEQTLTAPKPHQETHVAMRDDKIVGLISFGPASQPAFGKNAEIKHLYVAPNCKRMGVGKQLMARAFSGLSNTDFNGISLAVLRQNTNALNFYRAIGGTETGNFIDAGPLWKSENTLISWTIKGQYLDP